MTHSRLQCVSLIGLEALPVEVEVDCVKAEKLNLVIVGLPDTAVRESKDRVLTAIKNAGFQIYTFQCIVNLAPSDLKKEGVLYDLPIALGLLRSTGQLKDEGVNIEDYMIVGELALSGQLRPLSGAMAIALLAKQLGKKGLILPMTNAQEAAFIEGLPVYGLNNLKEAIQFLKNPSSFNPTKIQPFMPNSNEESSQVDFCDIKGQSHVKRALEIAAAGGHNMVLSGPPGCGKTLMAKALAGIMPELTLEEALEVTRIHSVAGLLPEGKSLVTERPFRSPHHTISYAGLIGGGSYPRPGEVSLAHHGILFLDELPEFSRSVLEVLRQPLEDRKVTISRANGNFTFPTNMMCIAAMNPCPCGYFGHPEKPCKDTLFQIERYRGKISGPLWDRMDIHLTVPALSIAELTKNQHSESSFIIKTRVIAARKKQYQRHGKSRSNAELTTVEVKKHCVLSKESMEVLEAAAKQMELSARSCERLKKVSRTIADLSNSEIINPEHILEALNLRNI